jgi:hypothetical protein
VHVVRRLVLVADSGAVHGHVVAKRRWDELDPRLRQAITLGGAFEAGLKVAALIDLAQQSSREIHGSRARWAAAIVLVNSGGLVPIMYFLRGRRR